jgi:hypothetical protein
MTHPCLVHVFLQRDPLQYMVFADTRYIRQFFNFALNTVQSFENHPGIKNK